MLRNLNLKWKVMLILVLVLPVLLGITLYQSHTFITELRESARHTGLEMARRYANKIDTDMSEAMVAARALALTLEGLAGAEPLPRREVFLDGLKLFLKDHEEFLGVFVSMEPNALDGKDAEYEGAPVHGVDNAFRPWVYRSGGSISMEQSNDVSNPEDPNASWYHIPRKTGQEIVMEPWAYDMQGEKVLMVDMIVPMNNKGTFIGVAGVDFPMGAIDSFVREVKVYESGYAVLLSNKGRFVAHPKKPEYVSEGKNIFEMEDTTRELQQGLKDNVLRGKAFSLLQQTEEGEMLSVYVPITIGRTDTPFMLGLNIPMDEVLASAREQRNIALGISLAGLVLLAGVILVIARAITRPVEQTMSAMELMAGGDLSVRLPADTNDEIGRMQKSVNNMAAELQHTLQEIAEKQAMAEENTRLAEQARGEAEQACKFAETAKQDGMHMAAQRLEEIVDRISSASAQVLSQAEEIRAGADNQRERLDSTATAMEQMNVTVLEVARNASETAEQAINDRENATKGTKVVSESLHSMEGIQKQAQDLKQSMAQLGMQAQEIGNIMNVIEDIADQTNLLALNAAIEAARAGEAGRGFAVVADEVRKLAEKTMGATKQVGDSIRAIQNVAEDNIAGMDSTVSSITSAVELSRHLGEVFGNISNGVESSAGRIQSIATATEQQSATSEEINRSVDEINQIAVGTSDAANDAIVAAEEMTKQAMQLTEIISELKAG